MSARRSDGHVEAPRGRSPAAVASRNLWRGGCGRDLLRCVESQGRQDMPVSLGCFFFSSRRRHTRLQGDWSSDVCSSDLKGVSMETTMEELAPYMRGWRSYFGFCETPEVLIGLTRWIRLRLRAALWRQWKTPRRRRAALLELGVRQRLASNTAGSGLGPWYLAKAKALSVGLSNAYFKSLGLPSLFEEVSA